MPAESEGVYVNLQELVRLKHQGQGFSFLPRQPVHSVLSGRHASRLLEAARASHGDSRGGAHGSKRYHGLPELNPKS